MGVQANKSGVTLTELLVVLAIIGILSTTAVAVMVDRLNTARIASARAEVRQIAEAQLTVLAIHQFFVPIQVLDDIPELEFSDPDDDSIEEENQAQINLIDPYADYSTIPPQLDLADALDNPRVNQLRFRWQGPFLQPKRVWIADNPNDDPDDLNPSSLIQFDHPLDPWGSPYRFYSPRGLIGSNAESIQPSAYNNQSFSNGRITNNDDRFDRWVILSVGRNGDFDSNNDGDDDIFYAFGPVVSETTLNFYN